MLLEGHRAECWALVPIKRRDQCKSRLTNLNSASRSWLAGLMLETVLAALRSSRCVGQIAVVSPAPDEYPSDVLKLRDQGLGLNAALEMGRRQLAIRGVREIIVLPADLPFLRANDVDHLVCAGRQTGFAIAPDAAGTGTNGLYLRADSTFRFGFGQDSCAAHVTQARLQGCSPAIVRRDGLAHDVDLAEDIVRLASHGDERYHGIIGRSRTEAWLQTTQSI